MGVDDDPEKLISDGDDAPPEPSTYKRYTTAREEMEAARTEMMRCRHTWQEREPTTAILPGDFTPQGIHRAGGKYGMVRTRRCTSCDLPEMSFSEVPGHWGPWQNSI